MYVKPYWNRWISTWTFLFKRPSTRSRESKIGRTQAQAQQQLRDLNNEFRDTQAALNQAQASLNRAIKLAEINYHRKRQAILANGHDDTAE